MSELLGFYRPHKPVMLEPEGESMTHQSFADECEINNIMKKYEKTGVLTHVREHQGQYGDFISAMDYHSAMNAIVRADEMFMDLPAAVRARFGNDPAAFLGAAQDPERIEEMRELGLAVASASDPAEVKPKRGSRKAKADAPPAPAADLEESAQEASEDA